jgi:hypothetical protein
MNNFGQYTVSTYLAPAQPLQITTGVGWEYIRIVNNSSYMLNINFSGMGNILMPEMFLEDIYMPSSYRGSFIITPVINLTTVSHSVSNLVTINAYQHGEIAQPQAQPLPQPAVTTTASGKPLYTATFGVNSSVGIVQTLNVFNPPNSGVNFTFHSAKAFTASATGNTSARIKYLIGGDLNLPTSVPAVSHSGNAVPPVSFAHVTADDSNNSYGNTQVEQYDLAASVTADLLDFPDNLTIAPGGNLHLDVIDSNSAKLVRVTLKWSEDIAEPPQGGVLTGMAITTLVNEGGVLQPVLKATKAGDTPEDITIMNDGTITTNGPITDNSLSTSTFAGRVAVAGLNFPVGSLTRWNVFTGSATNAGNLQAHGLGIKPDFVMFQETGAAGDANTFVWDIAASDATNVKVWTGNATARTYIALAIKL